MRFCIAVAVAVENLYRKAGYAYDKCKQLKNPFTSSKIQQFFSKCLECNIGTRQHFTFKSQRFKIKPCIHYIGDFFLSLINSFFSCAHSLLLSMIFWLGDLNYRLLCQDLEEVHQRLENDEIEWLLEHDQVTFFFIKKISNFSFSFSWRYFLQEQTFFRN